MQLNLSSYEYLRLSVVVRGTAGIPYDCRVRAEMRSGAFEGSCEAWMDGPDVEGFMTDLALLTSTLSGEACLHSDDGKGLVVRVANVDSLGHFVLTATLGERRFVESIERAASVSASFAFDTIALEALAASAIDCFREVQRV